MQADLGVVTLNGESIAQFRDQLPANVAAGVDQCLRKCGLKPNLANQGGAAPSNGTDGAGNGTMYGAPGR